MYVCQRKSGGTLTFMPSFADKNRAEISSTTAREILASFPLKGVYQRLVKLVIHPALLLQILGFSLHVPEKALVRRKIVWKPLRLDTATAEDKFREEYGHGWDMIVNIGLPISGLEPKMRMKF